MNKKKIIYTLIAILVVMQFFTIDQSTPEVEVTKDFIVLTKPNAEIAALIKSACYDCHSTQTKYPWYANIAPVSWWVKHHVEEGTEHLNFSTWGDYSAAKKDHKLEEMYEEVEEGEMPLSSYTWVHAEAQLTDNQKEQLMTWVKSLR